MTITAAQVKALREATGAPMMECKKALVACDGDEQAAIDHMRKSGQLKAAKKAGCTAAEGMILIHTADDGRLAMIEINSQTDFVAKEDNFVAFANKVMTTMLAQNTTDMATLSAATLSGDSITVDEARNNLIAKIGENIQLRRAVIFEPGDTLAHYLHGTRIGVIVRLANGSAELAKDIAMHIAAAKPVVVSPEEVPAEMVEKEREIYTAQAQNSGKPAEIIEKMVEGRVRKYLDEVCLLGQAFVKEPDLTVAKLLAKHGSTVKAFVRYEVGEGIEKVVTDFAEEVKAQVASAA